MLNADDDALLDRLQRESFDYFLMQVNPANGLVADKSRAGWPASIAATGLALTAYPVAVERGFMTRDDAVDDHPHDPALLPRQRRRDGAGCHRLQGLLLPLPRHDHRPARLAVRALDGRFRDSCWPERSRPPPTSTVTNAGEHRDPRRWPTSSTGVPTGAGRRTGPPR